MNGKLEKKFLKLASKPTYFSSKIFNENLVAVQKIKETLKLDKAAYVGLLFLISVKHLCMIFITITLNQSMVKKLN